MKPDGAQSPPQRLDWLTAYLESGHALASEGYETTPRSALDIDTKTLAERTPEDDAFLVPPYDVQLVEGGIKMRILLLLKGTDLDLEI